jgi:hypothetical protein
MKTITGILLLGIGLHFNGAFAEEIDGPANLRDKPNGKVVAVLNDKVQVEAAPFLRADKWFYVEKTGFVPKGTLNGNIKDVAEVNADTLFYVGKDNVIGKVLKGALFLWLKDSLDLHYGILLVYTHEKNIRKESVLENKLDSLFRNGAEKNSDFKNFLDANKFEIFDRGKWKSYVKYVPETPGSPGIRLLLGFQNGKLEAVISEFRNHFSTIDLIEAVGPEGRNPIGFLNKDTAAISDFKRTYYKWLQEAD